MSDETRTPLTDDELNHLVLWANDPRAAEMPWASKYAERAAAELLRLRTEVTRLTAEMDDVRAVLTEADADTADLTLRDAIMHIGQRAALLVTATRAADRRAAERDTALSTLAAVQAARDGGGPTGEEREALTWARDYVERGCILAMHDTAARVVATLDRLLTPPAAPVEPERAPPPSGPVPEGTRYPDGSSVGEVARYVLGCARGWEPDARIVGDCRAADIVRLCRYLLTAAGHATARAADGVSPLDVTCEKCDARPGTYCADEESGRVGGFHELRVDLATELGPVVERLASARAAPVPAEPPRHEIVLGADGIHRCTCGHPEARQHGDAFLSPTIGCTDALIRFVKARDIDNAKVAAPVPPVTDVRGGGDE